ncbi:DUF1810 domain-containing protein [Puia dinghuensis]|uniref:DUF1810 domain-containing protein n=1 Tax=Puia dinghuensis TaxID=1792502 RepID=A0A8J2XVG7_9BACT|nr:DUF1810 domain-containing protein [Puia dinghuensis]GGB18374.1 hypothetical protein GCM10011511_47750 [Puia dinghuensis]
MDNELNRFLVAQERDYPTALAEIRQGRKRSHWMWYIFPQLQGLGYSPTARFYAIRDLGEAKAYLSHETLGPRLVEISRALLALPGHDATAVMGSPDDLKLRSSMTLFSLAPGADPVFAAVLDKFYRGQKDEKTEALIFGY